MAVKKTKPGNTLRIIGGQFRGRKLSFADLPGLRPTGDRLRETLFNWLSPQLYGSRCLDLYTGSGALALECLSREAGHVTALDQAPLVINTLRSHAETLNTNDLSLHNGDAISWLSGPKGEPFDLVFIDPPFDQNLWQPTIDSLVKHGHLNPNAAVYIESGRDCPYIAPTQWRLHREKTAGQVTARLYFNEAD